MGRVSTCQKNCNTIDLRRAQVNHGLGKETLFELLPFVRESIDHLMMMS